MQAVMDDWVRLPDRRFRLLLGMARSVLDAPKDGQPAGTYWGGHERLASMLRTPLPPGDSPEARKARQAVLREVRREVTALVRDDEAVEVVTTGQPVRLGHAQTYRLTFPPATRGGADSPSSGTRAGGNSPSSAPREQGESATRAGGISHTQQGQIPPPRNKEEESKRRGTPAKGRARRSQPTRGVYRCAHNWPMAADGSTACPDCLAVLGGVP